MNYKTIIRNIKKFLVWYFSILLISIIILVFIYDLQINNLKADMENETENQILNFSHTFTSEISESINNVFLIKDLIYVHDSLVLDGEHTIFDSETSKQIIQNEFSVWLGMKSTYDQMRIIDNTGQEIIRVNYNQGNPEIVDDTLLQNKSDRYYFTESIILDENEVFLSPLDLNIENGEIEYVNGKVKPMIRIASPLTNTSGEKLGIIIVNYLADSLFEQLDHIDPSFSQGIEIINDDGYFLYAVNQEVEFGFMFGDKQDQVFSKYHDYDILSLTTSNIETTFFDDEYYTAIKISEQDLTSNIALINDNDIRVISDGENYIIYTEVEFLNLSSYNQINRLFLIVFMITLFIALVITRLIDEISFTKDEKVRLIKFDATHDNLTGLPNRKYVLDLISKKLESEDKFTVLFVDFDGFKNVNDSFGHDTGDDALIEGYKRIQTKIKDTDVLARMGGDEFVVVLNDEFDKTNIERICQDILDSFKAHFIISKHKFNLGLSIGACINNQTSYSLDEIINLADQSMYNVKKKDKNNYQIYKA